MPSVQVGPVNSKIVGTCMAAAGAAAGAASAGLKWAAYIKVGGGKFEVEFVDIDVQSQEFLN